MTDTPKKEQDGKVINAEEPLPKKEIAPSQCAVVSDIFRAKTEDLGTDIATRE